MFLLFLVFVSVSHGQIGRTVDKDSIIQLQTEAKKLTSQRKFNEALSNTQRALKYAELIENDSLVAESYHFLGIIYIQMRREGLAPENYNKAISYYKKQRNDKRLMQIYNAIGYNLLSLIHI